MIRLAVHSQDDKQRRLGEYSGSNGPLKGRYTEIVPLLLLVQVHS